MICTKCHKRIDDDAKHCPTCGGKGRASFSEWYVWSPIILYPIAAYSCLFLGIVVAPFFSITLSADTVGGLLLFFGIGGVGAGIDEIRKRRDDARKHAQPLPFRAGDRVRAHTGGPWTRRNDGSVVILPEGQEGTIVKSPDFESGTACVRWNGGTYQLSETVKNAAGHYVDIDMGTMHLDAFEAVSLFSSFSKVSDFDSVR